MHTPRHSTTALPGKTMSCKQIICNLLPSLFLPGLQHLQTLGSERNHPIFEALSLVNMELPHASNLNNIRGFEQRKFHGANPGMQECNHHCSLEKGRIVLTVGQDGAQLLIGEIARKHIG